MMSLILLARRLSSQAGRRAVCLLAGCVLMAIGAGAGEHAPRLQICPEYRTTPPEVTSTNDAPESGLTAIYYQGPQYQGKPTKVFAYYAVPAVKPGEKAPGMVLVHGGGGTAYPNWVRLWVSRGYAAIVMDLCGSMPVRRPDQKGWTLLSQDAGPMGWEHSFNQINEPMEDQWPNYAVNAIARARTLLGALPGVDHSRIGVTGISWGGYLTCLTAGLDDRYLFAVPVYGCGNLRELSAWMGRLNQPGMEAWSASCDPLVYLPQAKMPMLWVTGTNDFAYPLESLRKSALTVKSPVRLSIKLRMVHAHGGAGENPEEIKGFADSFCMQGKALAEFTEQGREAGMAWAAFKSTEPIESAELLYTRATGPWKERLWEVKPAELNAVANRVSAAVPEGTKMYFFNIKDSAALVVSSLPEDVPPAGK